MPETRPADTRLCRDCDGFPTVAITTGQTSSDGTRQTLTVTCRTCYGTGTVPRRAAAREVSA
ncbi:hypothetical protein Sgleb_33020 [Streptomyces glebosus]|uniref:Uncharacterized protein n=2 Tax=Streptomyces glebosus TaxID=249580 RepID=A0A640T0T4_9ACTN|nr:hypothetical protein [Streptomyces glebosus]GFE15255.1 hypothetical protein Sgleb_33020 [Streptomyces glebosus]GHG73356.1 hypothetical protein GCM10010513_46680 [Streptomyces glebosus]